MRLIAALLLLFCAGFSQSTAQPKPAPAKAAAQSQDADGPEMRADSILRVMDSVSAARQGIMFHATLGSDGKSLAWHAHQDPTKAVRIFSTQAALAPARIQALQKANEARALRIQKLTGKDTAKSVPPPAPPPAAKSK